MPSRDLFLLGETARREEIAAGEELEADASGDDLELAGAEVSTYKEPGPFDLVLRLFCCSAAVFLSSRFFFFSFEAPCSSSHKTSPRSLLSLVPEF